MNRIDLMPVSSNFFFFQLTKVVCLLLINFVSSGCRRFASILVMIFTAVLMTMINRQSDLVAASSVVKVHNQSSRPLQLAIILCRTQLEVCSVHWTFPSTLIDGQLYFYLCYRVIQMLKFLGECRTDPATEIERCVLHVALA